MRRYTRTGGAWAAVLLAGCGWLPGFGMPENPDVHTACAAWVSHINAMDDCVLVTYDANNLCAAAGGQPPEMASYYRCLTETTRCAGTELQLGASTCAAPLVALSVPGDPVRR